MSCEMQTPDDAFTEAATAELKRHAAAPQSIEEEREHHHRMMQYATALVSTWRIAKNWAGVPPNQWAGLADDARLLWLQHFIEVDAVALSEIKVRLYPLPFMHYLMDAPRRNALIPSVVVAANRLFAYAGLQQQLQQMQLAGDGDAM
jgi:hypothetical protein